MTIATPSIHPKNYYDDNIYHEEQKAVFESSWIFIGFVNQLDKPNDFITCRIGNTPVLIQNIEGELTAVLNICSHRKATLQTAKQGNRQLRCPYHCWGYGKLGKLTSVPQERSDFAFSDHEKDKLSLNTFSLDIAGDFVFVCVEKQHPSLTEFLGKYYHVLISLSHSFTDPIHAGMFEWKTNWKIAVETVLEVYHVVGTHPESFMKLAKPQCEIASSGWHNTGNTPLQQAPKKWWAGVRKHLKLDQHSSYTEYNHFFIFPNLAIGITNGSLMSVQTYDPISTTECELSFALRMIGRLDGEKTREALKGAVKENFVSFNKITLEEDRVVAESCQQNMLFTNTAGVLGKCEGRIIHFHQSWRDHVESYHE